MGLFNALFRSKKRTLVTYNFNHIGEDIDSPYLAQVIKNLMDTTSGFIVDPEDLFWFKYDDDEGRSKKTSPVFRAKFQREYGSGSRSYTDNLYLDNLGNLTFTFNVRKDGYQLDLVVDDDRGTILAEVMMILGH